MVDKQTINELIADPAKCTAEKAELVRELLDRHPWFQPLRTAYLKLLYDEQSRDYNHQLRKTAAHTADREILFDLITSEEFTQHQVSKRIHKHEEDAAQQELRQRLEVDVDVSFDKTLDPDLFERKHAPPKRFNPDQKHTFFDWLKLTGPEKTQSPVTETEPEARNNEDSSEESDGEKGIASAKADEKMKRIDAFLAEKPSISRIKKDSEKGNLAQANTSSEQLMTETLAKTYLSQKKYDRAMQAYEILILKNPEKSGFFADQISKIRKLRDDN